MVRENGGHYKDKCGKVTAFNNISAALFFIAWKKERRQKSIGKHVAVFAHFFNFIHRVICGFY